jgi:hypothetical protein
MADHIMVQEVAEVIIPLALVVMVRVVRNLV